MEEITVKMHEIAKNHLETDKLDLIIGWRKGRFEWQTTPFFVEDTDDIDKLYFDRYATDNLSRYLSRDDFANMRIGIFLKGCDFRSYNHLIRENRINPEQITVWGIDCPGLYSPENKRQNNEELIAEVCQQCEYNVPADCQTVLKSEGIELDIKKNEGERNNSDQGKYGDIEELEKMTTAEKQQYWEEELSRCIRCNACRNSCPLCNCIECILSPDEDYLDRAANFSNNFFYHVIRAFHQAGRCIECGECQEACPVDIPLMKLNKKLQKDLGALYGTVEPGQELNQKSPLLNYTKDDSDSFTKEGK